MPITLDQALNPIHTRLDNIERAVASRVTQGLSARQPGASPNDDDSIFAPYAAYVRRACQLLWPLRAPNLWFRDIEPAVNQHESAHGHIHKGAPLYNTGLCFFVAGDFARASQYIGAAGEEDEQAGRGPAANLLVAKGFSESLLLKPFHAWAQATFGADYQLPPTHALPPPLHAQRTKKAPHSSERGASGSPGRTRTNNPLVNSLEGTIP